MQEILLIGFYQPDEPLTRFLEAAQQEFNLPVRSGVCAHVLRGGGEWCPRCLCFLPEFSGVGSVSICQKLSSHTGKILIWASLKP